jgi:hypothetical protein
MSQRETASTQVTDSVIALVLAKFLAASPHHQLDIEQIFASL